ncbi:MAG: hypothetical protein N4A35_06655 [Flavobacteriales bacterium]|jgi:hypothetical protein|nr:hypothetical protein [Flavobacteriales bacterium]
MQQEQQTKRSLKYKLANIEVLESYIKAPQKALPNFNDFSFSLDIQHQLNQDSEIIYVITEITVFHSSDKENLIGKYKSNCVFKIPQINDFLDKELNLPENHLTTLNSISYSTTRGMMFSDFKGTFLHQAILPIVPLDSFKLVNDKE